MKKRMRLLLVISALILLCFLSIKKCQIEIHIGKDTEMGEKNIHLNFLKSLQGGIEEKNIEQILNIFHQYKETYPYISLQAAGLILKHKFKKGTEFNESIINQLIAYTYKQSEQVYDFGLPFVLENLSIIDTEKSFDKVLDLTSNLNEGLIKYAFYRIYSMCNSFNQEKLDKKVLNTLSEEIKIKYELKSYEKVKYYKCEFE